MGAGGWGTAPPRCRSSEQQGAVCLGHSPAMPSAPCVRGSHCLAPAAALFLRLPHPTAAAKSRPRSNKPNINILSLSRVFLFGARDLWFEVRGAACPSATHSPGQGAYLCKGAWPPPQPAPSIPQAQGLSNPTSSINRLCPLLPHAPRPLAGAPALLPARLRQRPWLVALADRCLPGDLDHHLRPDAGQGACCWAAPECLLLVGHETRLQTAYGCAVRCPESCGLYPGFSLPLPHPLPSHLPQSWTPQLVLGPLKQSPPTKWVAALWAGILTVVPLTLGIVMIAGGARRPLAGRRGFLDTM